MKKKVSAISLMIGLLWLFSSVELVRANTTFVDYTSVILVVVILGVFFFFLALVGWLVMRRLHQQRRKL